MSIVPQTLAEILQEHVTEVADWWSQQLYQQWRNQTPEHLLVWLYGKLDLGPIERACQAYRHHQGPGCCPTYRVGCLAHLLLVKYVYHWSFRQCEERLQTDLRVRWFVGLRPLERVPDHTGLWRFEQWVKQHQPQLYFAQVLAQIDADFPEEGPVLQIADTFALHGRVAMEGVVERLRHTSRCLLREWQQAQPQTVLAVDREQLFGAQPEPALCYLSPVQLTERQDQTVRGVLQLLQQVRAQLARLAPAALQRMEARLAELDKILSDTFQLILDAQGALQQAQVLPETQRGSYQIYGANDPQATVRNHGGKQVLGYNAGLAISRHGIIRAVCAATGATPDANVFIQLVAQQPTPPDKLIVDQAGSAGRTRAQVQTVSANRTLLVARIAPPTTGARFGPEAFLLDPSGTQLTCPQQRSTTSSYRSNNRAGRIFEFRARTCLDCPLWTACRAPDARPDGPRRVFLSDHQDQIRLAQVYNQTPAFAAEMKLRPLIERIILLLTAYEGLRQATSTGLPHIHFQLHMGAMSRNLRTWHSLCLASAQ
jgi:hypothetical protein